MFLKKVFLEQIIKEHNFQINTIASTFALNKNYKIDLLIPEVREENGFWSEPKYYSALTIVTKENVEAY